MPKTATNSASQSWTIGPPGWAIALFIGLWGALVGSGFYPWANRTLVCGNLLTIYLFARHFQLIPTWRAGRWKPFAIAVVAAIGLGFWLYHITSKAQGKAATDSEQSADAQKGLRIVQVELAEVLTAQKQTAPKPSTNEHTIIPFNEVVCTRQDADCLFVGNDQVNTWNLTVDNKDLPSDRKLVRAWCVPIDNAKDSIAFQFVTADIDPTQRNVVQLKALRAQPLKIGRVRYAVYAVTEPI